MKVKIIVISEPVKHYNKHSVCYEIVKNIDNMEQLNIETKKLQKLAIHRANIGLIDQLDKTKVIK